MQHMQQHSADSCARCQLIVCFVILSPSQDARPGVRRTGWLRWTLWQQSGRDWATIGQQLANKTLSIKYISQGVSIQQLPVNGPQTEDRPALYPALRAAGLVMGGWCTALVCATAAVLASPAAGGSAVQELDARNFDSFVKGRSFVAVLFFAPWCEFCKRAKPAFEQAGAILEGTFGADASTHMGTFEATLPQHEAWSLHHLVEGGTKLGVPAIKLFAHGRSAGHAPKAISLGAPLAIAQFVAARVLPQPQVLSGARALQRLRAQFNTSAVVLGLFGAALERAAETFARTGRNYTMLARRAQPDVLFAASNCTALRQQFEGPGVVLLMPVATASAPAAPTRLLPPWTASRLDTFLQEHVQGSLGVAAELCDAAPCSAAAVANTERFVQRHDTWPTAILILQARSGSEPYVRALRTATQKLSGRVYSVFAIERHFPQLLGAFGIRGRTHLPVLVVHTQGSHLHFRSCDSPSALDLREEQAVIDFIQSSLDGRAASASLGHRASGNATAPRHQELELDATGGHPG